MRNRVLDFILAGGPKEIGGMCQADLPSITGIINRATQRLLYAPESNDSGFWGGWAEMAFEVSRANPYLTTPREVARLESLVVCNYPVQIFNQFYEYMRFGFGRQPKFRCDGTFLCDGVNTYERGSFPTLTDIVPGNKIIRAFVTDETDANKRTFISARDGNNQKIYSLVDGGSVEGTCLQLTKTFVDTPMEINKVYGLQKDPTNGIVNYYEVDNVTGDSRLIASLEPSEVSSDYRRYYFDNLPRRCSNCGTTDTVQIKALAKLDFVPVRAVTDFLLVQNIEALINECQAVYYSGMDSPTAKAEAQLHHKMAIRLLNGELIHREGKQNPAILFSPFGSASLDLLGFGRMR